MQQSDKNIYNEAIKIHQKQMKRIFIGIACVIVFFL